MKRPKNRIRARTKVELKKLDADTNNGARRALLIEKNFDKAERLFKRLYRIRKEMASLEGTQFNPSRIYECLGSVYFARRRYGRALWFFTQAEKVFGSIDPNRCVSERLWAHQAKVHIARGNYDRANMLYVQAIESMLVKATTVSNRGVLSGIMQAFAAFLSKQDRYSEAETYSILSDQVYKQALALKQALTAAGFG